MVQARHDRRRDDWWRRAAGVVVAVYAVVAVTALAAPAAGPTLVKLFGTLVIAVGVGFALFRHRPPRASGWRHAGPGIIALQVGYTADVMGVDVPPGLGIANTVLQLGGVVLMAWGIGVMFGRRDGRGDVESGLDAGIVALALGQLGFYWLVAPLLADNDGPAALGTGVLVFAAIGLITYIVAQRIPRAALTPSRAAIIGLILLGVTVILLDSVVLDGLNHTGDLSAGTSRTLPLSLLAYGLLLAAAVHPSMREAGPLAVPTGRTGTSRVLVICTAGMVTPLLHLLGTVIGRPPQAPVAQSAIGAVAIALVLVRLAFTLRSRQQAQAVASASESRFRSLVEHAADGIAVLDADGTVEFTTPSVEQMLELPAGSLIGSRVLDTVHPDDVPIAAQAVGRALARSGARTSGTMRFPDVTGQPRWLRFVIHNLFDEPAVAGLVMNLRDVTDERRAEERLTRQATRDSLTGLLNRAALHDALQRAIHGRRRVAVLFLDLDRFKLINDSVGHDAGDTLLIDVANRLRDSVRDDDVVGRPGGDEFVIVASVADTADAEALAVRVTDGLAAPFDVAGDEIYVTASIGIVHTEAGSEPASALLRDADIAMYEAKRAGRNRIEVFDRALRSTATERLRGQTALRHGIDRGELRLRYQPIVDLRTAHVTSVEALVRWQRPDGHLVDPDDFIPLAEETGLIVPLGRWVLATATAELAAWHATRPSGTPTVALAVNVSPRELQDPGFLDGVRTALARWPLPSDALRIELTEQLLVDDTDRAQHILTELRSLGVKLSIDDFGTGWSSLSYLKRFPFDTIKIDRSFIDGLGQDHSDTLIVQAILGMASGLHAEVVAEGVETQLQALRLLDLGCDFAQGYLFAPPLPFAELAPVLSDGVALPWRLPRPSRATRA
ncbi:putative bifunctional diguanylate cyclase/phosphodiesterase [Nitriliruptor alkaliphilus]|uniref:putative bifunctional diguanylate cyclase/phosphodiesterase n=1 Tax=Nitriliruptor alkaliphilus TaxID=427918 RepID=UPI0006981275|nr:EAL domain-containing protein [Nitriliruptor alkaliphilus]